MENMVMKVTPDELKNEADAIQKQIASVEQSFEEVKRIIKKSSKYWEGEASECHREMYDKMKKEVEETLKRLKKYPVDLKTLAGVYEEAEKTTLQMIEALPSDIF